MSIKQRFVKRILEDEGRRLLRNQTLAIGQKLKTRSGRLLGTRSTAVSSASTDGGQLTFVHTIYERFLDMKTLRYDSKEVKRNRRIHNRFVFGHYNSIAKRLTAEYTEDTIEQIKTEINNE